jgi:predicted Zn-dependent protease
MLILAASGGGLYYAHRQKQQETAHVGPEAALNAAADMQREISRIPARLVRLSDEEETRVGDNMTEKYLGMLRTPLSESDAEVENYITSVGRAVSQHARRKLDYRFHYIPHDGFVNAFAVPGGHVFIGKGLLKLMKSEDELANVLGHEIEHVDNYHCNERVALRNQPLGVLIALPVALFQAGYSKEQELEADRDGADLAVRAGYSPQGAIDLFQTFARLERQYGRNARTHDQSPNDEISRVAWESIVGYFRSHPLAEEREAQIRRIMTSQNWPQPVERALRMPS